MTHEWAEVFAEVDFDHAEIARQKRDQRVEQLQSYGYSCRAENLRTIDTGRWVFVIHVDGSRTVPEERLFEESKPATRPKPKPKRYEVY